MKKNHTSIVQSVNPLQKHSLSILPFVALMCGFLSTSISQAAVYTWTNGAISGSVNMTNNNSWNPVATNGFYLSANNNGLTFTNNYTQTNAQTFDWAAVNVGVTNQIVAAYTKNVIFTNVGEWRFMAGVLTLTNSTGLSGTNAGTLYIYNTANSQLGNATFTMAGNMALYMGDVSGHTSSSRIVTQNLPSLCISNLGVTMANSSQLFTPGAPSATLTFGGTGTTTIIGSLYVSRLINSTNGNTNNSALTVGGTSIFNIASTNANNVSTSTFSVGTGATAVYGWNSGLIITNNGSVYVADQKSLGSQVWNVRIGTTNAGATTFGVFTSNEWATNSSPSVLLTNNFSIANSGGAANIFKPQTGKTLTLSGTISGSANGTVVADAGTLVLSGASTALSLPWQVTNNGTLVASNNSALGSGSVTVASGSTLKVNAAIANSVTNNGGVTIADGGSLATVNGYSGSGSLSIGATDPNTASFTSSLVAGTNNIGALSLSGNGSLALDVGTQIKSSASVTISGTNNRITVSGTAKVGTNNLVVATTSLTGAAASSIALNGSAVGSPSTPIALGQTFTAGDGTQYTFTSSSTALQLVVVGQGAQDLSFANSSGLWNTNANNTNWVTVPGGAAAAFRTGDSTLFNKNAAAVVDSGGVSPNVLNFANPISTQVQITGGPVTAATVTANGQGNVSVSSDLTAVAGININSGTVTLANTTINSGGITVAGGSLTNSGATTITAGGLNVNSGSLSVSGSISAGAVNVTGGIVSGSGSITGSSYNIANATYDVALNGTSPLTVSGNSSLGGNNSGFNGPVSVAGGSVNLAGASSLGSGLLNLSGGSVLSLSSGALANSIALGSGGGGISNSGDVTVIGAVTNATGQANQTLSKNGAGILTLAGAVGTSNPMIGLNINQGILQLQGSQYNITNLTVAAAGKLLINGGVLSTRQLKAGGSGLIEVTNLVTWSNSIGSSSFTNAILIDAGSSFISGPMTSTTYSLTFENGVSGPGYLEVNRCVDSSVNTNNINGWIGVGSMKVNNGALLRIVNGGFTNPSATITNLGKILVNNSSSVSNLISATYPGVTGVTSVTNKYAEVSGSGIIANSGSQTIYLDGLISGDNKISMEGSSGSSSIYLTRSNSFTGGIDFAAPSAAANNGSVWFLDMNALGSGPISNSINSSNAAVKTFTPAGGVVQDWVLTNTINTGTVNSAVMAFGSGASNSLTLAGKVSGGGQLKVTSSAGGELRVSNINNDYTGGTEVGTGAIVISDGVALGTGPVNFGTSADSILKVTDTTALTNAMTISGLSGTSTNLTPYSANIQVASDKIFIMSGGLNNKLSVGLTANDQKYGGKLIKQGAGTAELSGVNSYSGSTTINDGTLVLSGATLATPLVSLTGSTNAVLKLKATDVLSSMVNFTGDNASATTGTVDFNAAGAYQFSGYGESKTNPGLNIAFTNSSGDPVTATFMSATNYVTDPAGTAAGRTIYNRSTNLTLVFSGAMEIGSSTDNDIVLNGEGNFVLNGSVINNGTAIRALTKAGTGKAILNAVNSYNGGTTVSGGTLEVGALGSLPTVSTVTVSNGATLRFLQTSGSISLGAMAVAGNMEQNLITITSSGTVDLTGSTLTVTGTPTLNSYTLVVGTSVTGIPVLSPNSTVPGYALTLSGDGTKLNLELADTTKPVIALIGASTVNVAYGTSYSDLGATVTDNKDATRSINGSGSVNTSVPGSYILTFNATDAAGNAADTVTRTVVVGPAPVTFASAFAGAAATALGADGIPNLLRYAMGANNVSSPVVRPVSSLDTSNLSITAMVRINDANVTVVAESATSLSGWNTGSPIAGVRAADQTGATPGETERQVFSVPRGGSKTFLRLKAIQSN